MKTIQDPSDKQPYCVMNKIFVTQFTLSKLISSHDIHYLFVYAADVIYFL